MSFKSKLWRHRLEQYSVWNRIYEYINPIAFDFFGINVHWYGIMYVSAMLVALGVAKLFVKYNNARFPITQEQLDSFFIWVEIGVILGGRVGYVLVYSPQRWEYLMQPWQMFNPYMNGVFVGISGISYHGAVLGFVIAAFLFCYFKKQSFLTFMDLSAISIPLGYVLGRIGNFFNHELYGRVVESDSQSIGILVNGELRYPSQLFEAFSEGVLVFIALLVVLRFTKRRGILFVSYGIFYALARFSCEYFREADSQMGYYAFGLSMGQILSFVMLIVSIVFFVVMMKKPLEASLHSGLESRKTKAQNKQRNSK